MHSQAKTALSARWGNSQWGKTKIGVGIKLWSTCPTCGCPLKTLNNIFWRILNTVAAVLIEALLTYCTVKTHTLWNKAALPCKQRKTRALESTVFRAPAHLVRFAEDQTQTKQVSAQSRRRRRGKKRKNPSPVTKGERKFWALLLCFFKHSHIHIHALSHSLSHTLGLQTFK